MTSASFRAELARYVYNGIGMGQDELYSGRQMTKTLLNHYRLSSLPIFCRLLTNSHEWKRYNSKTGRNITNIITARQKRHKKTSSEANRKSERTEPIECLLCSAYVHHVFNIDVMPGGMTSLLRLRHKNEIFFQKKFDQYSHHHEFRQPFSFRFFMKMPCNSVAIPYFYSNTNFTHNNMVSEIFHSYPNVSQ